MKDEKFFMCTSLVFYIDFHRWCCGKVLDNFFYEVVGEMKWKNVKSKMCHSDNLCVEYRN